MRSNMVYRPYTRNTYEFEYMRNAKYDKAFTKGHTYTRTQLINAPKQQFVFNWFD